VTWRSTLFHSRYDNLTGYSVNVLSNLITQTNAGLESEVLAEVDLGEHSRVSAFGNYTYVRLLEGEDASGVSPAHEGHLTWAPAQLAKAGVSYQRERFSVALQGRYQGEVHRRTEDMATPGYASLRPAIVPAWFRLDANARYQLTGWASLELKVSNLLDAESFLVKNGDFPFDYRMEGRRIFGTLEINL
jgi:outer membrane receptor for ferrienterochelin and colicin